MKKLDLKGNIELQLLQAQCFETQERGKVYEAKEIGRMHTQTAIYYDDACIGFLRQEDDTFYLVKEEDGLKWTSDLKLEDITLFGEKKATERKGHFKCQSLQSFYWQTID